METIMNIIQGYAYHIKDSYFDLAQDKYLLQNADCIGSGACTGHCLQNIGAPTIMAELAELL